MIRIAGEYYDGARSRPRAAELVIEDGNVRIESSGEELLSSRPLEQLVIPERLGNVPRRIELSDGACFETLENDRLDRVRRQDRGPGLLHRLESKWRYVALALVAVAAFSWGVVRLGIPRLAEIAAFSLPTEMNQYIERDALKVLDDRVFKPSKLSGSEQQRLAARFAGLLSAVPETDTARVLFRNADGTLGANAIALPSGTIVFTDQLVGLAEQDEELIGVLAHELGHVAKRHGLRQTIQGSVLSLLAVVILGDVSSVSSIATALPIMLTQFGYSRDFEREADLYAARLLKANGISAVHLANMLKRLDKARRCDEATGRCEEKEAFSYLSTHPPTEERLRILLEAG